MGSSCWYGGVGEGRESMTVRVVLPVRKWRGSNVGGMKVRNAGTGRVGFELDNRKACGFV